MKHTVILALSAVAVGSAFAFSFSGVIRPRPLPEAYQIAVETIGSRTNELMCIEGKRLKVEGAHVNKDVGFWEFVFEGTNTSRVVVTVTDLQPQGFIDCPHK